MKISEKNITADDWNRIKKIYDNKDTSILPRILSYSNTNEIFIVNFEWIFGKTISTIDTKNVFYLLGDFHKKNIIKICKYGFITVCHGDFHMNNIIKTEEEEYKFIDVTYLHEGLNYSDLEYIDFYDLYDKKDYPWMIKEVSVFDDYLNGATISINDKEKEKIKRIITINYLKKCIRNGKTNGIDSTKEEIALKEIQNN